MVREWRWIGAEEILGTTFDVKTCRYRTGRSAPKFDYFYQYFTSRGFAVLDVDCQYDQQSIS